MKKFIIALAASAALVGAACSSETATTEKSSSVEQVVPAKDAKLAAVLIYADWCGSCKVLDPKIKTVKSTHSFADTAFVTLDFTAKDKGAFMTDAKSARVAMAVKNHFNGKIKTGQMLLIDLDDKKVIGVIDKSMNESAIAAAIEKAASEA